MEEFLREAIEALLKWFDANETWIKPISFVVSPMLAAYAFWGNQRTKSDLSRLITRYTLAKTKSIATAERLLQEEAKVQEERNKVSSRELRIKALEDDLRTLASGDQQLWSLRPDNPFPDYHRWYTKDAQSAKIVCFGNLKGGVGKTTLAANFAAYAAQHLKAQILIVDLDYQQSLSNMMLSAAGLVDAEPRVQNLFLPDCSLATIERSKVHLDPAISRGWLVPSGYDLSQVESRLLIELLLPSYAPASRVDVRYRLANALLRPEVRDSYGLIIIDMPPRLTMGGVNALIAAHHLVVPTVMDKLSAEAISQFLNQARAIKEEMKLGVELTAVVGTLSRTQYTADWHNDVIGLIDDATRQWSDQRLYRIERTLPRREDIARLAGIELAYNLPGAKGEVLRKRFFDPIFAEILTRIGLTPPP